MSNSSNLPDIIYHYTTQDGLLGILNEQALWATKIHYLNDASELIEPLRIANTFLATLEKNNNTKSGKDQEIKDIILGMKYDIEVNETTNICVSSFCSNPDLLSQWRAYGGLGSIYSIGFNVETLKKAVSEHSFEIFKCDYYDSKAYREKIEEFIQEFIEKAKRNRGIRQDFILEFIQMAATMKHDCFKEEDECRIVSTRPLNFLNERFSFRSGKSMIIPYYSIPLDLSSIIVKIFVGPCQHPDLTQDAIQGLVHKYSLYKKGAKSMTIDVVISDIPYRNF